MVSGESGASVAISVITLISFMPSDGYTYEIFLLRLMSCPSFHFTSRTPIASRNKISRRKSQSSPPSFPTTYLLLLTSLQIHIETYSKSMPFDVILYPPMLIDTIIRGFLVLRGVRV